jgi:hypothetical protein
MNFDGKITCEPGRTIARDNLPLFYINIARNSRMANDYNLAPWQADSIARQIAAAMRAGIIRVPAELADGEHLDANPPGAALVAALEACALVLANAPASRLPKGAADALSAAHAALELTAGRRGALGHAGTAP